MSSSDVLSSAHLTAASTPRKSAHLKLVDKAGRNDSGKADGTQGAKIKQAKGKIDANAATKAGDKAPATDTGQGQFSTLLYQVESKLNQKQAASQDDDTTSDDADTGSEDADDGDAGTSDIKSQNGTTSLFAAAFMMRGWEPALIAKADTSSAKDAPEEIPAAINGDKTSLGLKIADRKADIATKPDDGGAQTVVVAASNGQSVAPAKLPMADMLAQPVKAEAGETGTADTAVSQIPVPLSIRPVKAEARGADTAGTATPQVPASLPAQPVKAEARKTDATETAAPQILASAGVKAEAKIQSQSSPAIQDAGVKGDIKVLADAQASGVVSSIHVAQADEQDGETGHQAGGGKDDGRKDQPVAAKTEIAQPAVKAETVVVASAVPSTVAASPVSQVVERILQELPAQNIAATADQAVVASKVLTVRLSPEGLGNVLVRISNAGGTLKISLSSEQKTTSEQLKSDSSQLLQALQQVMPSFSSDSLSFSTQDQGNGTAQNNAGAGQNAMGGNANSGQWNEGQSYAEQGNRQVPGRSYGGAEQGTGEADAAADPGRGRRAGSIYL